MSVDEAMEEIVCNACERMLLNTKYAELMEKEKPNLFDAIRKWLSGLRDRIRKIFEGEGYSRENAYKEAKILWDVMDEMQEIWDRAMVQAQSSRLNGRQQRESGTDNNGWIHSSNRQEDSNFSHIKEQIDEYNNELNSMNVVASATVPTNLGNFDAITKWALAELKKTGYAVDRQGYGTIRFGKEQLQDGVRYARTPAEKAAFAVVDKVLKRGIEIGRHGNHKNRQKETVTFAAPVELNGIRGNMAVVVNVRGNNYYCHRIVLPDGSVFTFEEKNTAVRGLGRGVTDNGSLANPTSTADSGKIPQTGADVKSSIRETDDGRFVAVVDLTPENFKIKNADTLSAVTTQEVPDGVLKVSASDAKIPQTDADVKSKSKFSLREKKTPTYEELVSKTPVRIVDVRNGIESGTYAEMKGEVLEKAIEEKWFDEPHLNEDTNSLIFLTPKSFSHAFTNLTADFGEDTIRSMAHIPEIIKDAVLVSVNEPKNNRKAETGVYTFFGAINGANGIEPVKLTVKEYDFKSLDGMPQNIRSYFNRNGIMEQYDTLYDTQALEVIGIESIKEEPDASVRGNEQSSMAQDTSDSSELKVADLLELVKGDAEKYIPERGGQFKGSSREYNYDYLASKDDMQLTEVVPKERYSRSDIVAEGMKNAAMFGYTNNSGNAVVYIKDTDTDVIVTEKSIRHGLDRRINNQAPVIEKLGEVLSNSVKVNELIPRTENTEKTFVYVGAAKDTDNRLYIATFIVNRNTNELESYDVLYAANAKKEPAALLPTSTDNSAMFTGSVISISDLLDKVNKLFPDILSEDVLRHFGRTERPQGKIGENVLYSSREMRDTAEEAKGREESAAALRRENRILRERIEYWKKQSRVTKEYTLRNTDTLEYARELVKRLDSAATSAEVNQGLQEMGAYLLNAENVDWDMLWEHALTLAHTLVDDADTVISDELKLSAYQFEAHNYNSEYYKYNTCSTVERLRLCLVGKNSGDLRPYKRKYHAQRPYKNIRCSRNGKM